MSLPRLGLSLAVGLSAGLGLDWLVSRIPAGEHALNQLKPGVPYAIVVSSDRCELDLAFDDDGTQYLLVVSSLGSAVRSFDVNLESTSVAHFERFAARPVDPWV